MLRKIISLILILSFVLTLMVGCSKKKNDDNDDDKNVVKVEKILLEYDDVVISVEESIKLNAVVLPEGAVNSNLTWKSSNTSVAMVNNGTVYGVSEGIAIITVSSANNKYATCYVHVVNDNGEENIQDPYYDVLPGAKGFKTVDLTSYSDIPSTIKEVKSEKDSKGYVVKVEVNGYNPGMIIIVGISSDGIVTGATCLESNETNGVEKTYGDNLSARISIMQKVLIFLQAPL